MTFSSTNQTNLRLLWETQWGQTQSTGITRELNMTSHSLSLKKNTTKSNTIRDDRMVSDIIETEMMSDGGINFEFQAGGHDDLFQAFVLGTWTRPMTFDFWKGAGVSWTADNIISIVGPTVVGYITPGRRMKVAGFVNPVNNGFFQIASVAYAGGATNITFSTTTSIVEAGNAKSVVKDANDVIVLSNTAIRAGTAGASAFDSNSTNAFASALAVGQLNIGQKIHVEGLGYDVGTVTFAATCVAASTITVNDSLNSYTFTAGVDFAIGTTATLSATNLAAAINAARINGVGSVGGSTPTYLDVNAYAAAGVVSIKNLNVTGGSLAKTEPASGTNITLGAFAGGDATQHGIYTIVAVGSDVLTVTPAPTTNANAGSIAVTIQGSMLRNPSSVANIVPQSASLEAGFEDVGQYMLQDGQMVNSFSLSFSASAVLTGSFEFMGRATTVGTSTVLAGGAYTVLAPVETEIMNATTDVGQLMKNGLPLTTAIKEIKLDGKANLRNQMAVSSKFPVGIGTGRFELTGSAQCYFETWDLFNNFLNHDTVSLSWSVFDSTLNSYYFTLPAVKITADPVNSKGIDQDVMNDITFESFRDVQTQCMIQIDRFSSLVPV